MPLGMEAGLGPGDFVFDGDPAPRRKKGTAAHPILAHAYCVAFDTENRDQLSVLCKVLSKEIWLSTQFLGDRL